MVCARHEFYSHNAQYDSFSSFFFCLYMNKKVLVFNVTQAYVTIRGFFFVDFLKLATKKSTYLL